MEQRRLRLGDILDDYCPRERRVTNHAIVAMIEEDIKQTRCITCDAEHVYKAARVPSRRKKEETRVSAHDDSLELDDMPEEHLVNLDETPDAEPAAVKANGNGDSNGDAAHEEEAETPVLDIEDGPVHRPLIRATLPRPEGHPKEARQMPDFTVRQPGTRGNAPFRGDSRNRGRAFGAGAGGGNANGNGSRPHGRFSGPRPGAPGRPGGRGGGAPAGFRSGPPRQGGKKRSR